MENNHPTFGNGKICYIEIPATDVAISSAFYQKVLAGTSGNGKTERFGLFQQ